MVQARPTRTPNASQPRSAAQPKPATPEPAVARSARWLEPPTVALGELAFAAFDVNTQSPKKLGTEATIYRPSLSLSLLWTSSQIHQFDWHWQVSLQPYPKDATNPTPSILNQGSVTGGASWTEPGKAAFMIDLAAFPPLGKPPANNPRLTMGSTAKGPGTVDIAWPKPASRPTGVQERSVRPVPPTQTGTRATTGGLPPAVDAGSGTGPSSSAVTGKAADQPAKAAGGLQLPDAPMDFYIRLVPTKNGQLAGLPSNTVVAHYRPGKNPNDPAAGGIDPNAQQKAQAEFLKKAQVYQVSILSAKQPVFQDPARWGCIVVIDNAYQGTIHPLGNFKEGEEYCPPKDPETMQKSTGEKIVEGIEGFGKAWDGLAWAYDQAQGWVADQFKELVPCEWLGKKAESTCEDVAKQVAGTAMKAGLAAAGVPPSLPDLEALGGMAKGKAVDAAVDYTCKYIENQGGACTPAMREGLAKGYEAGLDQLKLSLETQRQEPGCGDVQTAKEHGRLPLPCFGVFGAKVKPAAASVDEPAELTVRVTRVKPDPDFLPACQVVAGASMKSYSDEMKKEVDWEPLKRVTSPPLGPLGVGQSTVVKLTLYRNVFSFAGTMQTPAESWWDLYRNTHGTFFAGTVTAKGVPTPDGYHGPISCGAGGNLEFKGTSG
jgi:hypothetical protein